MRTIRSFFIFLIIIGLIVAGGTKLLLWYYTDKTAKNIQNNLPPGMFNYTGISTSLAGRTSIDDITLIVSNKTIKIEKIELRSKNILDLITLIANNWGKKFPSQLALRLQGVEVNITDLLPYKKNKFLAEDIPCGNVKTLGAFEYTRMGYHSFIFDINLDYHKLASKFNTNIDVNVRDAYKIAFSYSGDIATRSISEFTMHLNSESFQKKLYTFCAQKENKSYDDYIATLPLISKEDFDKATATAYGLTLGDDIINAYNEYRKNPKELYFAIKPTSPVSIHELKAMHEQTVLEFINPSLRVNGRNIPVKFEWATVETLRQLHANTSTKKPIITSAERVKTPINELNAKAFNKNIEVLTASGVTYKGAFRKVANGSLYMTIHKKLGSSDLALKLDTVHFVYILSDY